MSANQLALEDAARTLGASRPIAFLTVTLPMLRTGLLAAGIMSFIVSFDNVPITIFLLGNRQQTIPVRIFNQLEYGSDPSVAAVSTILIVGTAIVLFAAERLGRLHRYV
jgi:putative spermidine/putrescine transport system permease protein